ncbi:hypothetical protein DPMN_138890 [Dreissena polymorpha]|uniref:Uncharacterized protein n=1 Tax=Dreissena polymorpha TaxID=45954 RepID=A0A9D4G8H2_DREPO|nr:hypothetical protein DPMN_138890 [Dreissena polymorpha]
MVWTFPGGDDGLRSNGFQLTQASTARCHTPSTSSQVRDGCCSTSFFSPGLGTSLTEFNYCCVI